MPTFPGSSAYIVLFSNVFVRCFLDLNHFMVLLHCLLPYNPYNSWLCYEIRTQPTMISHIFALNLRFISQFMLGIRLSWLEIGKIKCNIRTQMESVPENGSPYFDRMEGMAARRRTKKWIFRNYFTRATYDCNGMCYLKEFHFIWSIFSLLCVTPLKRSTMPYFLFHS